MHRVQPARFVGERRAARSGLRIVEAVPGRSALRRGPGYLESEGQWVLCGRQDGPGPSFNALQGHADQIGYPVQGAAPQQVCLGDGGGVAFGHTVDRPFSDDGPMTLRH